MTPTLTESEAPLPRRAAQVLDANLPDLAQPAPCKEPWTDERRGARGAAGGAKSPGRYVALNWPKLWGGREASLAERIIVQTELIRARARASSATSVSTRRSGADRARHRGAEEAPRNMRTSKELWCQGFSEPNAGSTRRVAHPRGARRRPLGLVSGQKVWTSVAECADWCFLLARRDPGVKKHAGISALAGRHEAARIDVRPLRQMTGEAESSTRFFDNVRVPKENVVGRPGDGWKIAMGILAHRARPNVGLHVPRLRPRTWRELLALAKRRRASTATRCSTSASRARIGDIEIMRLLGCRSLTAESRGEHLGPKTRSRSSSAASCLARPRARDGRARQRRAGRHGGRSRRVEGTLAALLLLLRAPTRSWAASSEVQHVIAHQLLGLPR